MKHPWQSDVLKAVEDLRPSWVRYWQKRGLWSEAEDLAQEGARQCLEKAEKVLDRKKEGSMKQFLTSVAINKGRDCLRKEDSLRRLNERYAAQAYTEQAWSSRSLSQAKLIRRQLRGTQQDEEPCE
jgi:DNA-directed RNA polymerase specialized sigma24 family protein